MVIAQAAEIMGCIYAGIIMGVLFCVFNKFASFFEKSGIAVAIIDFVYVALCFIVACAALYTLSYGEIRIQHFFGFAIGVAWCLISVFPLFGNKKKL